LRTAGTSPRTDRGSALVHGFLETSARRFPAKTAVVHENTRLSYGDLNGWANRLAHSLTGAGVRPGSRVILLSENNPAYVAAYYGILKAGAVVASLNTDIKPEALAGLAKELEPQAILVSAKLQQTVRASEGSRPRGIPVLVLGPASSGPRSGTTGPFSPLPEGFASEPSRASRPPIDPSSCAAIIYTSGSAGKPKGVMLSHANIVANTRSIVEYLELTSSDVQMVVLPFFYVMGKSLLNTHVAVGGTVVLNNKFPYTAAVLKQMAEERATGFSGVPSTYAHLLFKSPLAAYRDKLPALRYCSQAGGHMPARIKRELLKVLPGHTRLIIMYGATEASARLSFVPPDRLEAKIDSIGVPIPGVAMSVLSPAGLELAPGEKGEIVARGPNIMMGYFRDDAATRKVMDANGYHTGDLGYRDEDGFFFVTGRKDEQLKVGGHRIDPQEIEDAIVASGLAAEGLVFGIPDALLGHRLAGLVVPVPGAVNAVEEILRFCALKLPRAKVPGSLLAVELIPKTASGKPDRAASVSVFLGERPTKP
jgi:long-chain acyl-CoA synthetase